MGGVPWVPEPIISNPYSFDDYLQGAGAALSPAQQAALAAALGDLGTGGLDFVTLPGGGGTLMTNADGEVIGELHTDASGATRLKTHRINADGSVDAVDGYVLPSGEVVTAEQRQQQIEAQTTQAAGAVGLMNSIIGLQSWDTMSDLQRTAALVSIYNTVDALSGGGALPGNLGTAASVLGLLNALESGDIGAALYSGLYLVESLTSTAATATAAAAPGLVTDTLGGNFLPALGFVLALDSGNPVSIVASGLSLLSSLSVLGPWGMVAGVVLTLFSSMFGGDDIPMSEGAAHAQWDAAGNLQIVTDQDEHGGGPTAHGWMSALAQGLQDELARNVDENGHPRYGLVPQLLPTIGYKHDPDGFSYDSAQGHMFLSWVDENGVTQTRYYDGAGNRNDGSGETLAGDFMRHAMDAIAPAWAVQTTLAHWQAGRGLHLPTDKASLPQESADGMTQTLQVLTLEMGGLDAPRESLIDVDGDGYLEATQWVQANQSMLAIDVNGDGFIGADELVNLQDRTAFNSLAWLDANGDGRVDDSDPAFSALRLWMDVNGDGISRHRDGEGNGEGNVDVDEARSLKLLGIQAIDFTANPPRVVYAHGRTEELTVQMLTADTLGVAYQLTEGGVLEITEQADGSGVAVLAAVNTRKFDGQEGHVHGGQDDTGRAEPTEMTIDAGDDRVHTTSANSFTRGEYRSQRTSTEVGEGDTRLADGEAGTVLAGQAEGERGPEAGAPVFVPLDAATGAAGVAEDAPARGTGVRQVTGTMVKSAEPPVGTGLDLTSLVGIAIGAGAAQWPTVVSAQGAAEADGPAVAADGAGVPQPALVPPEAVHEASQPVAVPILVRDTQPIGVEGGTPGSAPDAGASEPGNPAQAAPTFTGALSADVGAASPPPQSTTTFSFDPDLFPPTDMPPPVDPPPVLLDHPQVAGEHAASTEDTVLRFSEASLLANDSTLNAPARPDEPMLRITSVFAPVHGSVSLQTDAQGHTEVVFIPETDYHGAASFSYTVTDQYGLSRSATVSMDVAAVNDAPVAQGEHASGDEDHALLFTAASLLANDSDVDTPVDGDVLRITRVGAAEHGQVYLEPDGTARFVPDANYNGPARFTYWVGDRDASVIAAGVGHEVPATVNLTILPVNDLPVVQGEIIDSDEDVVLEIDPALLLANDTDVDAAPFNAGNAAPPKVLAITAVGDAQHGSVELLPNGRLRFVPERDYFGPAGFSYTVDDGHGGQVQAQVVVNLAPVNDAPLAQADTFGTNEDEVVTLAQTQLLANDSDVDNPHADLVIVAVDNATHGTVSLDASGSIRFVPEADHFGVAQFTYTVSDGVGGFTVGTASLNIAPVNDAPRLVGEQLAVDEDTQLQFATEALLLNDADVDNPHEDMQITAVGDAINGDVRWVDGEIVFTPQLNFHGVASFRYAVEDGMGGVSLARVDITFNPVNDAPVANDELIWGKRDITYTLTPAALLANDTDVESPDGLRIAEIANVQHGSATLNANGSVTFVPEAGYAGRGSFDYWIEDPQGARSMATAQIDFSRINQTPTLTDDSFTGYEDIRFSIAAAQLLANDTDDGDPAVANLGLRVTAVADASNGTASLDAGGNVSFMPRADFHGTASFRYQVTDPEGASTWARAFLTVQSVNDAPIIEDVWYDRAVYGYEFSGNAEFPAYLPIYSEDRAALLNSWNGLMTSSGTPLTASFYRNGHMRPIAFDSRDLNLYDAEQGWVGSMDHPYRQSGAVVAFDPDGDSSLLSFSMGSGPVHGHAWANRYLTADALDIYDAAQVPGASVAQAGAWQYLSHRGDTYSGSDPFTIRVTDGQGASTTVAIAATHSGSPPSGGWYPVVIDLANDGIELVRPADSNIFMDINGDGHRDRMGWAAPSDAVLVLDANQDGRVDLDHEVSFVGHLPGARTDLEGLVAHDSNGDGLITSADDRWKDFGLFQDRNGNGVQDDGEFLSLEAAGLRSISLTREGEPEMNQGNVVFGTSAVAWSDGSATRAADVMFAGDGVPLPDAAVQALLAAAAATAEDARIAQMALLFNQMAALPDPGESPAATVFVPPTQEHFTDEWLAAAICDSGSFTAMPTI